MYYVNFKFKYPGQSEEESFDYKIPDDILIEGVKKYISDTFNVELDGTNTDIWNMCFGICKLYGDDDQYCDLFDTVEEKEQAFFREKLEDEAFEAFKEEWESEHPDQNINESKSLKEDDNQLLVGDIVKIIDTDDIWQGKTGTIQNINDNSAEVLVDFLPDKKTIQNFELDNLEKTDIIDGVKENLNEDKNMRTIAEINWNGHHYTFENEYHNTGTKSHDVLFMTDDEGHEYKGESVWVNRPWHRFDLEEAWCEIVEKAFGSKALKLAEEINDSVGSVTTAINKFFEQLKPEDIKLSSEESTPEISKKDALAEYLKVEPEEINELDSDLFEHGEDTYRVLTEEEADDAYENEIRANWQDMGFEGVTSDFKEWILDNALDEDKFEDIVKENVEYDIADMMDDDEIVQSCVDEGVVEEEDVYTENGDLKDDVDTDDLKDKLIASRVDDIISNIEPSDYFKEYNISDLDLIDYIDEDKVVEALKDDWDMNGGRGAILGSYDGEEIDLGHDLLAYLQ